MPCIVYIAIEFNLGVFTVTDKEVEMPVITIEAGDISKEQKNTLIEGFTKVASETLNIPAQAFVVILKENKADNIGSGGKMLSKIMAEHQG